MKSHYGIILGHIENRIETMLKNLVTDKDSFDYGGYIDRKDRLVHPGSASGALLTLVSLYLNPDSKYFGDPQIYQVILLNLDYLERVQREDGTFDLLVSNFYSSPDTGFMVHNLARAYKIMERYEANAIIAEAKERLYNMIKRSGYGMVSGGFHTPNHRWVVAAALMMAYNIVKEEAFKEMALRYLAEGIDCDENGEFTERSAGIYNAVNDNALIILAEEMGEEELLKYVALNLDMMLYYIEPDGSIFTYNSRRQDKGEGYLNQKFYPTIYYDLYMYMAYKFKNSVYAQMADYIMRHSVDSGMDIPNALYLYMLVPELREFEIELSPLPTVYEKYYKNSGIVRVRRDRWSYTLLKGSSAFLFMQNGGVQCYVKLCASFYAKAQFKAESLEKVQDGYIMKFTAKGFYLMPFEKKPATSVWDEMDHTKRQIVKEMTLDFIVTVKEVDGGIELTVTTTGCDRVPVKLEVGVTPYSVIEGKGFIIEGNPGGYMFLKEGCVKVIKDTDCLVIGPGFNKHMYAPNMRGSEPKSSYSFTIYMTDFTNIDRTVYILPKQLVE